MVLQHSSMGKSLLWRRANVQLALCQSRDWLLYTSIFKLTIFKILVYRSHKSTDTNVMTYNQNIITIQHEFILHNTSDTELLEFYIFKYCTPKLQLCSVLHLMLECLKNFKILWIAMDTYMHVLLE